MLSEQQQRIMGYFIEEAKDHLNTIEQGLLNLKPTLEDPEMANEIFRAAHSVKGGAAMLGLTSIQHTAHRLEDYFKVLKECALQIDQKLETMLLRVYDTLQELVEQLQGPFGLTDDKAEEAMTAVEPVFVALNQYLEQMVSRAGAKTPEDVSLSAPATAATPARVQSVQAASEESALRFIFQNDVPARLREMLQLFKQPDSAASRQQLQAICQTLAQSGEQLDLAEWCSLIARAERAILNPDNTYRTLAPIVIKDIKQAQEQVLAGNALGITPSNELLDLLPDSFEAAENDEEIDALASLLGADDFDLFVSQPDITAPDFAAFELPNSLSAANLAAESDFNELFGEEPLEAGLLSNDLLSDDLLNDNVQGNNALAALADDWLGNAPQAETDSFLDFSSEFSIESGETGETASSDSGSSSDFDFSLFGAEATPDLNLADLNSAEAGLDSAFDSTTLGQASVGPTVGTSELNTLADLFEGEDSDLSLSWQEEIMDGASDSTPELELSPTSDFSGLLDSGSSAEVPADSAADWSNWLEGSPEQPTLTTPEFDFSEFDQSFNSAVPLELSAPSLPVDPDSVEPDTGVLGSNSELDSEFDLELDLELESGLESGLGSFPELTSGAGLEEILDLGSGDLFDQPLGLEAESSAEPNVEINAENAETEQALYDLALFDSDDTELDALNFAEFANLDSEPAAPAAHPEMAEEPQPVEPDPLFAEALNLTDEAAESENPFAIDLSTADLALGEPSATELFQVELESLDSLELVSPESDPAEPASPEFNEFELDEFALSDLEGVVLDSALLPETTAAALFEPEAETAEASNPFAEAESESAWFESDDARPPDPQTLNLDSLDSLASGTADWSQAAFELASESVASPEPELSEALTFDAEPAGLDDIDLLADLDLAADAEPFVAAPGSAPGWADSESPEFDFSETDTALTEILSDEINANEINAELDFGWDVAEPASAPVAEAPQEDSLTELAALTDLADESTSLAGGDIADNLFDFGLTDLASSELDNFDSDLNLDSSDFEDSEPRAIVTSDFSLVDLDAALDADEDGEALLDLTASPADLETIELESADLEISTDFDLSSLGSETFDLDDLDSNLFASNRDPDSEQSATSSEVAGLFELPEPESAGFESDSALDFSDPSEEPLDFELDLPEAASADLTSDLFGDSSDDPNADIDKPDETSDETSGGLFDLGLLSAGAALGTAAGLAVSQPDEPVAQPLDQLDFEDGLSLFDSDAEPIESDLAALDADDSSDGLFNDLSNENDLPSELDLDDLDSDLSNFDGQSSEQQFPLEFSLEGFATAESFQTAGESEDSDLESFSAGDFGLDDLSALESDDPSVLDQAELERFAQAEADLTGSLAESLADDSFDDLDLLLAEDEPAQVTAEAAEFDDLAAMLAEEPTPVTAVYEADEADEADDFSDLEALIGDAPDLAAQPVSPATQTPFTPAAIRPVAIDDEFGDLEALLQDADQALGGAPARKSQVTANRRPSRRGGMTEQNMRVSVKHLDNLNNLVGEMVVNRNTLEQAEERLRQFLDNLLYQVQQLSDVGQRMRDLYERSLLESSLLSGRRGPSFLSPVSGSGLQPNHATGASFDALEMDRFTGFHTLSQEMIELIVRVRESASDIDFVVEETDQVTRNFRQITTQLQEGLTRSRMVPFAQTADRLPRGVRDNALKYGKQAELVIEGRDTLIDKMIVELLYDPMTHLVNNAVAHGIETPEQRIAAGKPPTGRITIRAFHQGNQTVISVSDDGGGINPETVRAKALTRKLITATQARDMTRLDTYDLLFHHGFSTADQVDDLRGRGVGLDVVRNNLNEIRGAISIDSTIGKGTTFTIRLPLTLSISKALCCISNRARIAFPMDGVEDMIDVPRERIQIDEQERPCIQWRDELLPFQTLSDLLRYNRVLGRGSVYGGNQEEDMISIVILRSAGNFLALQVDQVLGEQEIVIKQLEGPVPKPLGVAGATVLGDGRIMPIADVLELIDLWEGRIRRESGTTSLWDMGDSQSVEQMQKTEPTVLIVDDSITVRELLSMTFNKVGYRVEQARDGQEAWEKLRSGLPCDLVFCDIEMPRMDGLELLSRIQKDSNLSHLPIAMLTSRGADRHRQMAVQLGAKGYFTKPYLEEVLLDAASRMLKGEVMVNSANTQ